MSEQCLCSPPSGSGRKPRPTASPSTRWSAATRTRRQPHRDRLPPLRAPGARQRRDDRGGGPVGGGREPGTPAPAHRPAPEPEGARRPRGPDAEGQPEAAHRLAAHALGRAGQPRVLGARVREAVPRLRGAPAHRRGDGRDPRAVRVRREDGPRLRGRRGGLQALPRLPGHPAPAAVQRPQVEVRRLVGQPHPVRLRVLRAGREGDEGPELPRRLQDLHVGGPAGRAGLGGAGHADHGPHRAAGPREGPGGARGQVHHRERGQPLAHPVARAGRTRTCPRPRTCTSSSRSS